MFPHCLQTRDMHVRTKDDDILVHISEIWDIADRSSNSELQCGAMNSARGVACPKPAFRQALEMALKWSFQKTK